MIKRTSIAELKALVREKPGETCIPFSEGRMFAVLNGNTSCLTGNTQKIGEIDVDDKRFTIYVGGSKKETK